MPEAVPTVLLNQFKHLKITAKQAHNIRPSEIASIGSLGDMPLPTTPVEKAELRAENRKDKKSGRGQDSPKARLISRPIRLLLMMEAPIIKDNVERLVRRGQTEYVRQAKNDSPSLAGLGQELSASDGQRLIVNGGDLETEPGGDNGMASLSTAHVQESSARHDPLQPIKKLNRIGRCFFHCPAVLAFPIGAAKISSVDFQG